MDIPGLGVTGLAPGVANMPAEGTEVIVGLRPEHVELVPGQEVLDVTLTEALGGVSYAYLQGPTGETLHRRGTR